MDVVLARPKGFELDPKITKKCHEYAAQNGSTFEETDDMEAAFEGAHVVYPKSWGALPFFAHVDENGKKIKEENLDGMNGSLRKKQTLDLR